MHAHPQAAHRALAEARHPPVVRLARRLPLQGVELAVGHRHEEGHACRAQGAGVDDWQSGCECRSALNADLPAAGRMQPATPALLFPKRQQRVHTATHPSPGRTQTPRCTPPPGAAWQSTGHAGTSAVATGAGAGSREQVGQRVAKPEQARQASAALRHTSLPAPLASLVLGPER